MQIRLLQEDEAWAKLPTSEDDEFWWACDIYWISTYGRVFWFSPRAPPHLRSGLKAQRIHKSGPTKSPHWTTNLHVKNGGRKKDKRVFVHRLVLATHAGPHSKCTPVGRHGKGGTLDNRITNLCRGTHSDNLRDQYAFGERVPANQYTADSYEPDPELGF